MVNVLLAVGDHLQALTTRLELEVAVEQDSHGPTRRQAADADGQVAQAVTGVQL